MQCSGIYCSGFTVKCRVRMEVQQGTVLDSFVQPSENTIVNTKTDYAMRRIYL